MTDAGFFVAGDGHTHTAAAVVPGYSAGDISAPPVCHDGERNCHNGDQCCDACVQGLMVGTEPGTIPARTDHRAVLLHHYTQSFTHPQLRPPRG